MRYTSSATLIILYATSLTAAPTDYVFRNIADTSGGAFTNVSNPTINNQGGMAFFAVTAGEVRGIFTGPNPATDTFADNAGDSGFDAIGRPAISDNGMIVFAATTDANPTVTGIYRGPNIADALVPSGAYSGMKDPFINNSGKIAFWGIYSDNVQGIFTGPNPGNDTIADTGDFSYFDDLVGPRITNQGAVAFIASTPTNRLGIFTGPDSAMIDNSGLIGGIRTFDINDNGDIIAAVQLIDETPALLVGADPLTDQLSLDNFGFAGDHVAINNAGKFVFDGQTLDGKAGLFTGEDPASDRVLMVGDELFGQPLKDLFFDHLGFNDKGEVAFTYRLQDDTWGIAVATPVRATAIPLPAALPATALLACAFATHSTFRKWRVSMRP